MRTAKLSAVLWLTVATAQEPTCRLEGRVLDAMRQPVANAELTAALDGDVVARTRTDASGQFVFGRLPQRVLTVTARADTPAVGAAWLDLLGLERQFATIPTLPARTVRGVAVDENGRAIGGAWVVALARDPEWPVVASLVQAGADGNFVLTHVPCGPNLVRVWAPDHECSDDEIGGSGAEELRCVLTRGARQERAFRLVGADTATLAGARLQATATNRGYPLPLPPPLRHPAAENGVWRLRGWPVDDEIRAQVALERGGTDPPVIVVPRDCSGGTRTFTFVAEPGVLRGKLPAGAVPAGAWLVAEPADAAGRRTFGSVAPDGAFACAAPVANGEPFTLRLLHPEWTLQAGGEARSPEWSATHEPDRLLEPQLRRATRIRLRMLRPDGTPASGTAIRIVVAGGWLDYADVPPPPTMVPSFATGCTALDGRLDIGSLNLPEDSEFVCIAEGAADGWTMKSFRSHDGELLDLGDLPLPAGATIDLQCASSDPSDAVGAEVWLFRHTRGMWVPRRTICDREGRARVLGLPAGVYSVGWLRSWRVVTIEPGDVVAIELRQP